MQVDPRATAAWWAQDNSSLLALLPLTWYTVPETCHHTPKWSQEASLPIKHGGPTPQSLRAREPLLPHQRARLPETSLRGGKLKPATLQEATEALFPQDTWKPTTSYCTYLKESHVSPDEELKSQLLH
jgi:hypothetical protein